MSEYNDKYWDERLSPKTPQSVKNAIKRVYASYPHDCMPQGVCDPMYIMNTICFELGIGDGKGNFKLAKPSIVRLEAILDCDFGEESEEIRNIKLDITESLKALNKLVH